MQLEVLESEPIHPQPVARPGTSDAGNARRHASHSRRCTRTRRAPRVKNECCSPSGSPSRYIPEHWHTTECYYATLRHLEAVEELVRQLAWRPGR